MNSWEGFDFANLEREMTLPFAETILDVIITAEEKMLAAWVDLFLASEARRSTTSPCEAYQFGVDGTLAVFGLHRASEIRDNARGFLTSLQI